MVAKPAKFASTYKNAKKVPSHAKTWACGEPWNFAFKQDSLSWVLWIFKKIRSYSFVQSSIMTIMGRNFFSSNGMAIKFCENLNIAILRARRRRLRYKKDGGWSSYLLGFKKAVWVYRLGCSASKAPQRELRVLSRKKKYDRRYGVVLGLVTS